MSTERIEEFFASIWEEPTTHSMVAPASAVYEMKAEIDRLSKRVRQLEFSIVDYEKNLQNAWAIYSVLLENKQLQEIRLSESLAHARTNITELEGKAVYVRTAIERAIRLLPDEETEEASTLEMEIEARGYLREALEKK